MDIIKLFEEKNALLQGHFLLSSGLHSNRYMQCALILQYPGITEQITEILVDKLVKEIKGASSVTCVLSPAIGGLVIGQEIARILGKKTGKEVRAIFTEREEGRMTLRRGFQIGPTDNVIVVEDVLTTGGTTKELIEIARNCGSVLTAVACMIDRSKEKIELGVPIVPLQKLQIETYKADECPLCRKNIPLVKPGSKKIPARAPGNQK